MADNGRVTHAMKAVAATALAAYGFKKGGLVGTALGIVGAGLGATEVAAVAGIPLAEAAPQEVREAITVTASPAAAYGLWSRFEDFPRFLHNVVEVRRTSANTWHWTVAGPLGQHVEWDAQIVADVPGEVIAWRSTTADVNHRGEVRFEQTANGTRVLAIMRVARLAGPLGSVIARLTGNDPAVMVRRGLRRFKQLVEADEAARAAQVVPPEAVRLSAPAAE
ncbi:MAG TPA: SRPBCC family protein [Blastocatellia bacterium]|nr:SRPBCC family protein [Blastocatellia bacterium]